MTDLAARLRRLLFLVPYVARQTDGVPIADLARELGVGREELLANLDILAQVGPPEGDPGEYLLVTVEDGRVFVDLAQRLTRPLRLTPAEGCSLLLGLRTLRRSGIAPYDEALSSAERKLLLALGAEAGAAEELASGTVVASEAPAVVEHLRSLVKATRQRRMVEIDYASASSGRAERCGLEPYGVVQHAGAWYVIGRCRKRGDTRTFRVDRIARLAETRQPFEVPADFDLEAYRRERIYVPGADAHRVRVRLDPVGAARIGAAWPAGEVRALPDGGAEIDIEAEGLEWILGWVLAFGRHAEIVSPEEARAALRERVAAMVKEHA